MRLRAVIFDLDQTLLDWDGRQHSWLEHERIHLERLFTYLQGQVTGLNNFEAFFDRLLNILIDRWTQAKKTLKAPHLGDILFETLRQAGFSTAQLDMDACLDAYDHALVDGVRLYPDVLGFLRRLQGQKLSLGLITNSVQPMRLRDRELAQVGLLEFFPQAFRLSAADVGVLKPHPDIFKTLLRRMEVKAEEAVFVGDNLEADIKGAQKVGMKAVWRWHESLIDSKMMTGFSPKGPVPDGVIHRLDDLVPLFDKWYPQWQD